MATGLARGAAARGKKIAFGDGRKLIRGPWCEVAFRHNPNIANSLTEPNLEWINYHKGNRIYNKQGNGRWIWNYDFRPVPGEFFFSEDEKSHAVDRWDAVLIEPNVPWHKPVAPNKDWGKEKYQRLADWFRKDGLRVFQMGHGKVRLSGIEVVDTQGDFRKAVASLSGFGLAVLPEGGLHHAAAAVGTRAVVLFGGFIPVEVTGYSGHMNLNGGAEACGSFRECPHCRAAMQKITVEEVYECAAQLYGEDPAAQGGA